MLANEAGTTTPVELQADLDGSFMSLNPPPETWIRTSILLAQVWARNGTSYAGDPFCSKLDSFTSVGLSGRVVRWLVEQRGALSSPLREARMEKVDELEPDDKAWLESNLERFELFEHNVVDYPNSDLEDDDIAEWSDEDDMMHDEDEDDFDDEDDEDELGEEG